MTDLTREQIVAMLEDDYVSAERAVVDSILRQLLATLDALAEAQAEQPSDDARVEFMEALRTISTTQSLSVAQLMAMKLIKDLGRQNA